MSPCCAGMWAAEATSSALYETLPPSCDMHAAAWPTLMTWRYSLRTSRICQMKVNTGKTIISGILHATATTKRYGTHTATDARVLALQLENKILVQGKPVTYQPPRRPLHIPRGRPNADSELGPPTAQDDRQTCQQGCSAAAWLQS